MKQSEYISRKIKKLMREGYPQRQAVAIAFASWRKKQQVKRKKKK